MHHSVPSSGSAPAPRFPNRSVEQLSSAERGAGAEQKATRTAGIELGDKQHADEDDVDVADVDVLGDEIEPDPRARVSANWAKLRRASAVVGRLQTTRHNLEVFGTSSPGAESFEPFDNALAIKTKPGWIILPSHPLRRAWDGLIAVLLVYIAFVLPWRVALVRESETVLDLIINCIFAVDMVLSFMTAFTTPAGALVTRPRAIAARYLKSWFIIDLIATLPLQLMMTGVSNTVNQLTRLSRVPRLLRTIALLRMLKYTRVLRLSAVATRLQHKLDLREGIARVVKFFVFVVLALHMSACFWFLVAVVEGFSEKTWVYRRFCGHLEEGLCSVGSGSTTYTCTAEQQLDVNDRCSDFAYTEAVTMYLDSFYFCLSTWCTVGFGDVSSFTNSERVMAMLLMGLGISWFSFTISNISSVVGQLDKERNTLHKTLDTLRNFARDSRLPHSLYNRSKAFVRYAHALGVEQQRASINTTRKERKQLLGLLPSQLRMEVVLHLHRDVVGRISFLRSNDPMFTATVVQHLHPVHAEPGDILVRVGDPTLEMFFVAIGRVDILSPRSTHVLTTVVAGSYFGENALIQPVHVLPMRARTHCHLFTWSKKHMLATLRSFPLVGEKLAQVAMDRLQHMETKLRAASQEPGEHELLQDAEYLDDAIAQTLSLPSFSSGNASSVGQRSTPIWRGQDFGTASDDWSESEPIPPPSPVSQGQGDSDALTDSVAAGDQRRRRSGSSREDATASFGSDSDDSEDDTIPTHFAPNRRNVSPLSFPAGAEKTRPNGLASFPRVAPTVETAPTAAVHSSHRAVRTGGTAVQVVHDTRNPGSAARILTRPALMGASSEGAADTTEHIVVATRAEQEAAAVVAIQQQLPSVTARGGAVMGMRDTPPVVVRRAIPATSTLAHQDTDACAPILPLSVAPLPGAHASATGMSLSDSPGRRQSTRSEHFRTDARASVLGRDVRSPSTDSKSKLRLLQLSERSAGGVLAQHAAEIEQAQASKRSLHARFRGGAVVSAVSQRARTARNAIASSVSSSHRRSSSGSRTADGDAAAVAAAAAAAGETAASAMVIPTHAKGQAAAAQGTEGDDAAASAQGGPTDVPTRTQCATSSYDSSPGVRGRSRDTGDEATLGSVPTSTPQQPNSEALIFRSSILAELPHLPQHGGASAGTEGITTAQFATLPLHRRPTPPPPPPPPEAPTEGSPHTSPERVPPDQAGAVDTPTPQLVTATSLHAQGRGSGHRESRGSVEEMSLCGRVSQTAARASADLAPQQPRGGSAASLPTLALSDAHAPPFVGAGLSEARASSIGAPQPPAVTGERKQGSDIDDLRARIAVATSGKNRLSVRVHRVSDTSLRGDVEQSLVRADAPCAPDCDPLLPAAASFALARRLDTMERSMLAQQRSVEALEAKLDKLLEVMSGTGASSSART